jgi:hypothetical protein
MCFFHPSSCDIGAVLSVKVALNFLAHFSTAVKTAEKKNNKHLELAISVFVKVCDKTDF